MQGGGTVRGGTVNSVNRQHSLISTLIGSFAFITRSTSLTNSYNSSVSSFSFIVIRRYPRARSSLPVRVLCATVHSSSLVEQHSFFKLTKFRPALVWDHCLCPRIRTPSGRGVGPRMLPALRDILWGPRCGFFPNKIFGISFPEK